MADKSVENLQAILVRVAGEQTKGSADLVL